ncbi:hypothetical protein AU476_28450 [Cupriavidus sp. UYMSc13B]|nr:hypothetical protein AU476_28450 [Cupriavidus sp. UYMSc13B]
MQEVPQDMTALKIHAAESHIAVRKKNIPILSFFGTRKCSDDGFSRFDDLRIDASTSATQRQRMI